MDLSKKSSESEDTDIDISSYMEPQITQPADFEAGENSDHFFEEDLVWPDPENVFKKASGIKPSVLCAELKHLNVGGMDLGPKTRCQSALTVRKRPRPKNLPWNVVVIDSDPPLVDEDDVDEYLVHDPLFVEFFNAFLALPSFPEPVCFNIESGGFEVVTDSKQKLAQQIKEAVRSQNDTDKMYETRKHAFSDIPVVPIEDTQGPEKEKINTSFDVMALNKEQGILWVKSARLPLFLESDYYFQYRLAKVISQASIFNENGEFVVMKIDYTTKQKTKKKTVEELPPSQEEIIIKQMFVSFGDLKGAAKEAWFTQAKGQLKTEPTYTTQTSRFSVAAGDSALAIKPSKKSSVFQSHYFGVYTPGLTGPNDTEPPIHDVNKLEERKKRRERPFTPRPADRIHADTAMLRANLSKDPNADEEMVPAGHVVFMWPKQDMQKISSESNYEDKEDREVKFAQRMKEHQIIDQIYSDGSWEEGGTGNIVLKSLDELGAVIVGAVMKKTVAEMLVVDEGVAANDPAISNIYPSKDLTCVSVDKLHLCVVVETSESHDVSKRATPISVEDASDAENFPDRQPVHMKWNKPILKSAEEDPDAESILDSDEDFEERDINFRRNKNKWHSLTSLKGIQAFKQFLRGTEGEKYWELWIDIDKGRLIRNEEEKQKYIMVMRDKFYKKGSAFELSAENKRKLGLENLTQWIPEHLFQIQAKVLEPLVLYWAPRYLLSHLINTRPEKYYLYNEMISSTRIPPSDPYPHTQELLPLRPKSCCPRSRLGPGVEEQSYDAYTTNIQDLVTTPRVGNRRVYGEDTIQRLLKTPTAKYLKLAKGAKKMAKADQIPDTINSSVSINKSSSDHQKTTVVKTPPNSLVNEDANEHVSQQDVSHSKSAAQIQSQENSMVQPNVHDVQKEKLPCPFKPLDAILGTAREQRLLLQGPLKKPKDLLFPMVKIVDTVGGRKYTDLKSTHVMKTDSQEAENYTFFRQDSRESRNTCELHGRDGRVSVEASNLAEVQGCDFLGSERMEFLLQALHHEHDAGRTFRKFIEKSKREDWMNNLDFWEKVQEYRKLFYKDKLDLHIIIKQAKSIFSQYIVECSPQNIEVAKAVEVNILEHLSPPYEDLFDRAEENALKILFEAFQLYLNQDMRNYCKVERALIKRRLETRNTNILNLQKQGIIKEKPLTPDDPMEGYIDPVYDDSVLSRIPEKFKGYNMDLLAQNKLELEYFRQFLIPRCAEIDLKCWMDMEAWRRTAPEDHQLRDQRAKDIKKNYLNKKYFFGPNSPASKDGQNKVMEVGGGWGKYLEDKPHYNTILKAQKYVRARLEKKHLPFFLLTRDFQERHLIDSSITEPSEDAFMVHKKRSVALLKVISEAEEAFVSLLEKKEKLFADLYYWTKPTDATISDKASATLSALGQEDRSWLSMVKSDKSKMTTYPVLPQITPKSEEPAVQPSTSVVSKPTTKFKPTVQPKPKHQPTEETSPHLKKIEPPETKRSYARWEFMEEKFGHLITPMGLITHVIKTPSETEQLIQSKWIACAREIFLFQRGLKSAPVWSQFKKYISLSGGFLENDILFWTEVHKYKQMHKSQVDVTLLQRKVNAIINCFINSYLPPPLQIDIPQEMADQIIENKNEASPYLFREAQLAVFRLLLPHWLAFREYHKRMGNEERILSTLDRHRAVALTKEKKFREELTKQREIERQYRLQQQALAEAKAAEELDAEGKKISFSYSDYLAQQEALRTGMLEDNYEKSTQTVRGIPQYPYQPIEERPGYEDDPDVDEAAKHYSIVDYIVYKEYLKQDRMRSSSSKHVAKGRKSHSSIKSSIDLEPQLSSFDQAGVSEEKNPENEPTTSQTNVQ